MPRVLSINACRVLLHVWRVGIVELEVREFYGEVTSVAKQRDTRPDLPTPTPPLGTVVPFLSMAHAARSRFAFPLSSKK